jgi:hypothetical protein
VVAVEEVFSLFAQVWEDHISDSLLSPSQILSLLGNHHRFLVREASKHRLRVAFFQFELSIHQDRTLVCRQLWHLSRL